MPTKIEMIGRKFNRLTVLSEFKKNGSYFYNCKCDCGNDVHVLGMHLRDGHTKSCGCLQKETIINRSTVHGLNKTPEYYSWQGMLSRCYYQKHIEYANYGGRGISVCRRWKNSFQNFIDDMGFKPSGNHSLDRINTNEGYSPDNCRWATRAEQSLNRTDNHRLEFNGRNLTIKEWSNETGFKMSTICNRINRCGWSIERSLTEKPINYKRKNII